MRNWEKFETEIKAIVKESGSCLALKDGKPANCGDIVCKECIAKGMNGCEEKIYDWLYAEVEE